MWSQLMLSELLRSEDVASSNISYTAAHNYFSNETAINMV
jgi:hypothetical protein